MIHPHHTRLHLLMLLLVPAMALSAPAATPRAEGVFLEEMTAPELRDRIAQGATTVLVPIGGTEQNGPHMVLGKHNVRVRILADRIARKLGNAVVAPVLAYVPEGSIHPPTAHMRFSGTISIPEATFESILEGAARSLQQHGFRDIVFLGDHGGYQNNQMRVATRLNRAWGADSGVRVHALPEYYAAAQTGFAAILKAKGYTPFEIGTHAGLADTALTLALDPSLVRLQELGAKASPSDGVYGDPRRATAEDGQSGVAAMVDASVTAIRNAIRTRSVR